MESKGREVCPRQNRPAADEPLNCPFTPRRASNKLAPFSLSQRLPALRLNTADSPKKRIVIKIGTGVLTLVRGSAITMHHAMIARIVQAVAELNAAGHQVILVSSGAVAAGLPSFGLTARPSADDMGMLQACAAAGQARLMHIYESHFVQHHLKVAQLLLTHDDITDPKRRANIVTTLENLMRFQPVVPIINENDSVAVYELKVGDNDVLSSEVACLIQADLFILLTSVPGLRRPGATSSEDIVERVENLEEVLHFASDEKGSHSVGGMKSKLQAVGKAVAAGIETLIAHGGHPEQLPDLVAGGGRATRFLAAPRVS